MKIEIFVAGTPFCRAALELVRRLAGGGEHEIFVRDVRTQPGAATLARAYGIASVPAVIADGVLRSGGHDGVSEADLLAMGLKGQMQSDQTDRLDAVL
jgi:hypothetical protein